MPFAIERQSGSNIIRARMSHLFTLGDASGLMQAYIRTLGNSGPGAESLDLLVDVSNAPIQSGEVILALSDFLRQPQYRPARIAFVHGDKAIKMQARRVSADLGGRHFSTEAEALAWLASDERRTT